MATREDVIAEARSWMGTPYHHHARVKSVGVDCAQLLIAVYQACGLVPEIDVGNYSTQWHLHRSRELYLEWLEKFGMVTTLPKPGDAAIWRFGRTFSHAGIVLDTVNVIHALRDSRCVTITGMHEQPLAHRPVKYYTLFRD